MKHPFNTFSEKALGNTHSSLKAETVLWNAELNGVRKKNIMPKKQNK